MFNTLQGTDRPSQIVLSLTFCNILDILLVQNYIDVILQVVSEPPELAVQEVLTSSMEPSTVPVGGVPSPQRAPRTARDLSSSTKPATSLEMTSTQC